MSSYWARVAAEQGNVVTVEIGFGHPAHNNLVVPDAIAAIQALRLRGGVGLHFTGAVSIPAAMALAHCVGHLYQYIACFDPKLDAYVVSISHSSVFSPGHLIPSSNA